MKIHKRGWLRPIRSVGPESTYHWEVTTHKWDGQDSIQAWFTLRDCSESVSFDCHCTKKKHVEKHRKLVATLIEQLEQFDAALVKAMESMRDE